MHAYALHGRASPTPALVLTPELAKANLVGDERTQTRVIIKRR